jgi:hypothetical protein
MAMQKTKDVIPLSKTFVGLCDDPQRAARVRSPAAIRSLPGSMVSSTKSPTKIVDKGKRNAPLR